MSKEVKVVYRWETYQGKETWRVRSWRGTRMSAIEKPADEDMPVIAMLDAIVAPQVMVGDERRYELPNLGHVNRYTDVKMTHESRFYYIYKKPLD